MPTWMASTKFRSPSTTATAERRPDISVTVTDANETPMITSDGGGATATINVAENTTAVTTVTATDADLPADTLTYTITGGADSADSRSTPARAC